MTQPGSTQTAEPAHRHGCPSRCGWPSALPVPCSGGLEVTVSDDTVFVGATAVAAFATSTTIAGFLWRGQSWTRPEPDEVPVR